MREIKFRLIKDNKIVGYEIPTKQPNGIFGWSYQINYIPHATEISGESGWSGHFIKHDIKNQYTGLRDMHNNEIYEGDILVKDGRDGKIVVLWDINCFTMPRVSWLCEIIGNIYENPELVEVK